MRLLFQCRFSSFRSPLGMGNIVWFALLLIVTVNGECPDTSTLPVISGSTFHCAVVYTGWGADQSVDACNGSPYTVLDGTSEPGKDPEYYPMGSLIVMPGCTYYGYSYYGYQPTKVAYTANTYTEGCLKNNPNYKDCNHQDGNCGLHHSKVDGQYPCGFESYKCRCVQKLVDCVPKDDWNIAMTCDNSQSDVNTTCEYQKQIGTTWTKSTTNSISVSTEVSVKIKDSFFGLFEDDVGVSVKTGYDWTKTSTEAKSDVTTTSVTQIVPAHKILVIENAVGECGGNRVDTEMYRIRDKATNLIVTI